jgi:[NiFe] hydrogenase assembly HybE family chaperone
MDDDVARAIGDALAARYAAIHQGAMRDMPVCNPALGVAAAGFRPLGANAAGVVVAPWFMNLAIAGPLADACAPGARVRVALPAGDVDFVAGTLDGFGAVLSCSLFSPMFDFAGMAEAEAAAREAMRALFDPALLDTPPTAGASRPGVDRRALFLGAGEARP